MPMYLDEMEATVDERVARGAALLDERVPDWRDRIDLDRLTFEGPTSPQDCILGQLFEEAWIGCQVLGINLGDDGEQGWYHYGFNGATHKLTEAWRRQILSAPASA